MPAQSLRAEATQKTADRNKKDQKPVALILAGYNQIDSATREEKIKEVMEAYDGDVIYMGQNKFLQTIAGKPVIQYVIDAVSEAKKNNERLYDKIYIYNDIDTINQAINLSDYPDVIVKQMKDSVGGHLKDFCRNYIDYGQRVDIFYGDTPRITPADVEYIHKEYSGILGKMNYKKIPVSFIFSLVESKDLSDNWLEHRIKYIKVGKNKGKLKHFMGFVGYQARIGNSSSFILDSSMDDLIDYEVTNFFYDLRKALSPSSISKIIYYLWRTKHFKMIRQIKNKCMIEYEALDNAIDIVSKLYKIDLSRLGMYFYHIKKNASRWENDVDSPLDLETMKRRFNELEDQKR